MESARAIVFVATCSHVGVQLVLYKSTSRVELFAGMLAVFFELAFRLSKTIMYGVWLVLPKITFIKHCPTDACRVILLQAGSSLYLPQTYSLTLYSNHLPGLLQDRNLDFFPSVMRDSEQSVARP